MKTNTLFFIAGAVSLAIACLTPYTGLVACFWGVATVVAQTRELLGLMRLKKEKQRHG